MVIIIDGNQLACRCYFSLDKLTTKEGVRTETIYGFLMSLKKIMREYKDEYSTVFLTWDGGNDKRKAIYPLYKSGRKPFESAFYDQLEELRDIISRLGIKQYHIKTVEADDLIGTLTLKSRKKGKNVFIVSSDHDFEQLISRHVKVLHPMGKNIIKDVQYVLDTYEISPDRLVEVMSLTGDSTDHIPGLEGVGDKTASRLIIANGCLDNVITNVDNLMIMNRKGVKVAAKDELKQQIKDNIENIKLANKLVQIDCDLDIEPDFSQQLIDFKYVFEKFKTLDFEVFCNEFESWKVTFDLGSS